MTLRPVTEKEDARQFKLWNDYINFMESNHDMHCPEFGFCILSWTVKMLFDTSPHECDARHLIIEGFNQGKRLYKKGMKLEECKNDATR